MAHVLIVDDEPDVASLLRRLVESDGHVATCAADGAEAWARLAEEYFELVLCDIHLAAESGLELAREILAAQEDVAVVMVTGVDDPALAETALGFGAYGYVVKPFRSSEVCIAVVNALRRRRLEIENRAHRERLEQMVADRTAALTEAIVRLERQEGELQRSREQTIQRLAGAVGSRHHETGQHIERVSLYCALIADHLGVDEARRELIRIASPLHDVGKIALPDRILLKPGRLSPEERTTMQCHTEVGYELLTGSGEPMLDLAAVLARTHHERYDGGGYPLGLRGDAIPLEGRIIAVADVFDALTSDRVYRPRLSTAEAAATLREERGSHFDPRVVDAFLASLPDALAIGERFLDPPLTRAASA